MHGTNIHDGSNDIVVNAAIKIQATWITKDVYCQDNKEKKFSLKGFGLFGNMKGPSQSPWQKSQQMPVFFSKLMLS